MSDAQTENAPNAPKNPYSEVEFDIFLKEIGEANISTWSAIAEALGVDRATIYRWRQHPLAKEAIATGIKTALSEMERYGKDDWRMWREKAKILGVRDVTTLEHEAGESVKSMLDELEQTKYDELGRKAKGQVVADNAPLQDKE